MPASIAARSSGMIGVDRGQGLGDRHPMRDGFARDVIGTVLPVQPDPGLLERRRVRRRPAGVTPGDERAGVVGEEGRGARAGTRDADDVEPLAGGDRRAGRAGARPAPMAAASRVT